MQNNWTQIILKKGYDINTRVDGGKDLFTAVAEQLDPDHDSNDMKFLIELINGKKIFGLEGAVADLVIFGIKNRAINPKTELTFTYKEKVETGRLPIKFHTFFGNNAKIEELLKNYSAGKTAEEVEAVKDALKKQNETYFAPQIDSVAPMVGGEGGGGGGRGGGGNAAATASSSGVGAWITERGGGAAEADRAGSAAASGEGGGEGYAKFASTPASTARVSPSGHPPKPNKGCCTVS